MSPELVSLREIPTGGRVLCAVSGGADSMCLLHLLWSRRRELDVCVFAAHFEHGLRGEESLRDAAFVESWCRERGIPLAVEHGDVPACARAEGLGIEEAARTLRYDFLERTAEQWNCSLILTAHNADDNAETVLLNLTRGAGPAGLAGIPARRGRILRPLLGCTREEIERYLRENRVAYVEDSSNRDDGFRRNRLRHQVLPVLRELNPEFAGAILRAGKLLRQDEDCLGAMAEAFIREHFDGDGVPAEKLNGLHPAVASRVIRRLCAVNPEQRHVEQILELARRGGSETLRCRIPGQDVVLERGRLIFTEPEEPQTEALPQRTIEPGRSVEIPEAGLRVRAELAVMDQEVYDLFKTLNIKCENIYGRLRCTGRLPGDRIHPAGRGCSKGLKALFQEAGVDRRERMRVPMFRDDRGLLAVYGLAIDERAAAAPGDRVLRLRFGRINAEGESE